MVDLLQAMQATKNILWVNNEEENRWERLPEHEHNNTKEPIPIPREDVEIEQNKPISNEIVMSYLKKHPWIPTPQEFDDMLSVGWYLYEYLVTSREDGEELFPYIKQDLLAWIYGEWEKNTKSIDGFVWGVAIIASKIKADLQWYPIMKSIVDYILSPRFLPSYNKEENTVLNHFFNHNVIPLSDGNQVDNCWLDFKKVLKRNLPQERYRLYVDGITIHSKPSPAKWGENRSKPMKWIIMYPWNEALAKIHMRDFENDVIMLFVDFIQKYFNLDCKWNNIISIEYGADLQKKNVRDDSNLRIDLQKKTPLKRRIKPAHNITIHDGNRDADKILEKRLFDQLSLSKDDSLNHCLVSWHKGTGKSTLIYHYLYEFQNKFPRARIYEVSIKDLARQVSAIAQEKDNVLRNKWFNDFWESLKSYNILYLKDFDQITNGKYRLRGQILDVIDKSGARLILESEASADEIEKILEKDNWWAADPDRRKTNKHKTKSLRERLWWNVYSSTLNAPSPIALKSIIQSIAKGVLKHSLPESIANYLAGSLYQSSQCKNMINSIRYRISDVLQEIDKEWDMAKKISLWDKEIVDRKMKTIEVVAKKVILEQMWTWVQLSLSKVYEWFEEFCEIDNIPVDLKHRSEMFAGFMYVMTEPANMWNPFPQNRKIEDISRQANLKSKKPTHKKLAWYYSINRNRHEARLRCLKSNIESTLSYWWYQLDLRSNDEWVFDRELSSQA